MEEKVFDRVEKKYLIEEKQKNELLKSIEHNMQRDSYYKSGVLNIYFDNDNYDLIIQSIDRPIFKEKLRARSYVGYDRVFLEIKTKLKGKEYNSGYKRRVMITHNDYKNLIRGKKTLEELSQRSVENANDLQIAREVDYLISQFNLKPKILVTYDRESYKNEDGLRITFDENLRYRDKNVKFDDTKRGKMFFKDGRIIMEIKAHGVLPLWLVKKLSELHLYPQQFSKVGKIYEKIRKEQNV